MSTPGAPPQRVVGHFACTDANGATELLEVALEPRHWRALYDATATAPDPGAVLPAIFQALEQVTPDRFDEEVAAYIEAMFPGLPPRLGTVI